MSNDNLMHLTTILNANGLQYWLDGESLRRSLSGDPTLLSTGHSIELGLHAESLDQLQAILPELRQAGFKAKRYYYRAELFRISLHKRGTCRIHLHLYRIINGTYYCPTFVSVNAPQRQLRWRLAQVIKKGLTAVASKIELSPFFMRLLFGVGTYMVPLAHFSHMETTRNLRDIPIPHNAAAYVAARFSYEPQQQRWQDLYHQATKPEKLIREQEYQTFTEILHRHQIPYCMDSGVLLGLIREGALFPWEKDVDLQMWYEDAAQLKAIIPELQALGWKVTLWQYRGQLYQFRISRPRRIPVHIMLFRKEGEMAWCPASRTEGNPYTAMLPWLMYAIFSKLRTKVRGKLVTTDISRWPWSVRRQVATWWVPATYFEQTEFSPQYQVYLPIEWDSYLTFRYGTWRVPAQSWDFWQEDGAMNHQLPHQLVDYTTLATEKPSSY
ncbi:MAG: LicD family protein [Firmicutes bacterium]|nr:LicD family protein [Bacillota bacterium]